MMSDKYKKDKDTSFKTEDFVDRLYIKDGQTSSKKDLIKTQGKDFFSKKSSHGILYEMMHQELGYSSSDTDIDKEDVAGLGKTAYTAFCNTYEIYINPFYDGHSKTSQKNKIEMSETFEKTKSNFKNLTINEKLLEKANEETVAEKREDYFASLKSTKTAMENLRKIALKHKNIRAFLMANCFVDRIGEEMKKQLV